MAGASVERDSRHKAGNDGCGVERWGAPSGPPGHLPLGEGEDLLSGIGELGAKDGVYRPSIIARTSRLKARREGWSR